MSPSEGNEVSCGMFEETTFIRGFLTVNNLPRFLTSTYEMGKIPILSPSIPSAQFSSTLRITVRISSCKTERKDGLLLTVLTRSVCHPQGHIRWMGIMRQGQFLMKGTCTQGKTGSLSTWWACFCFCSRGVQTAYDRRQKHRIMTQTAGQT